jgi:hypothetical protein
MFSKTFSQTWDPWSVMGLADVTINGSFSSAEVPPESGPTISASVSSFKITGGTCTVRLNPSQPPTITAATAPDVGWNVVVPVEINTTELNPPSTLTISVIVTASWRGR